MPFWSPDGQFLGFAAPSELRRIELATHTVRAIVPVHRVRPLGASWGPGDTVLYADLGKIFAAPVTGGPAKEVADSGPAGEGGELRWPQMLEDGKHFTYFASGDAPNHAGTYWRALDSNEVVRLIPEVRATYAPPDQLLYVRDKSVMAQAFDISTGQLKGPPMTVPGQASAGTTFSASSSGVLVQTELTSLHRLVWLDRKGMPLGTVDVSKNVAELAISPTGEHALLASVEAGAYEVWLVDLARSVTTKVATDGRFPTWAPDGQRFAFTHMSGDGADVYVASASGTPDESAFLKTKELKSTQSWSEDGRFIVFAKYTTREQTSQDLWLLPTSGDRKPFPYLQTKAGELGGRVSPDGRWIAYSSDETGATEVYIQSFPTPGAKVRVSTAGGGQPRWRRDGRELFYLAPDQRMMSVSLTANGSELRPSTPHALFVLPSATTGQVDVTPDGQRFLTIDWAPSNQDVRINLLTSWTAARRP